MDLAALLQTSRIVPLHPKILRVQSYERAQESSPQRSQHKLPVKICQQKGKGDDLSSRKVYVTLRIMCAIFTPYYYITFARGYSGAMNRFNIHVVLVKVKAKVINEHNVISNNSLI